MFNFLRDKDKWNKVRNEEAYKPLRDMLFLSYKELCENKEIPQLPFSLWMDFVKTGNRKPFEDLYFLRRKQMSVYGILCMLYPEKEEYIIKLEDILCEILDEHCWSLPAHLPADRLNSTTHIDLFAAETGLYMAEMKYILNDRLNPLITERITQELDRRIVQSFKNNIYVFEEFKSNWAAVCGGAVGMVLLYENPDVYMEVKPRIEKCMTNYLESIGEDGSVSEGLGYWGYGFGFYCLYNDMLKRYTFDRIDYFENEKVKKLANFFSEVCMSNSTVYSYSDSSQNLSYNISTIHYLNRRFKIDIPSIKCGSLDVWKFSWVVRAFLYYNPEAATEGIKNRETYYEDLQCYIKRKDKYAFAIKGGHNKEEHNHNDVGSFVIVADDKQVLCDLGAPIYTAHTLSEKAYDDVLEKASFGHNVPIINGKGQGYGREYCGELKINGNDILVDMKDAYLIKPDKLLRRFSLEEDKIRLIEEVEGVESFTERFVSEIKPEIENGYVKLDCMTINFNAEDFTASYESVKTLFHSGKERTVYLIDISQKNDKKQIEITFEFSQNTTRNGDFL